LFCDDADALTGEVVELADITAALDAGARAGWTRVVLSGGEPTLHRQLLAAIRHAKGLGLYVILTTNGRVIQHDKVGQMLQSAGLDEVRVSLHASRRHTHDTLTQAEKSWMETKAAMKVLGRTNIRVVANTVLTRPNVGELRYLMHSAMQDGAKELHLRRMQRAGRATSDAVREELVCALPEALLALGALWVSAKDDNVLLTTFGLEGTADAVDGLPGAPQQGPLQADEAALRMLRQRVRLYPADKGFSALDVDGFARGLAGVAEAHGGVAQVGHELAVRGAPVVDLPPCLGGPGGVEVGWAAEAAYAPACADCPRRAGCGGLPKKLVKAAADALGPLPWWSALPEGRRVVALSLAEREGPWGPALIDLARRSGAEVVGLAEIPEDASVVLTASRTSAVAVPARPRRERVLYDLGGEGGAPLVGGEGGAPLAERWISVAPGRVAQDAEDGVPLRAVRWSPPPLPDAAFEAPPDGFEVLWWGARPDRELRRASTLPATVAADLGPSERAEALRRALVVVFAPSGEGWSATEALADLEGVAAACAAGRPVVTVRGPWADGWVAEAVGGRRVRAGDALGLAAAVRALTHDADAWSEASARARAWAVATRVTL
jgi:pyruvate-formate lyase-activating enzyme